MDTPLVNSTPPSALEGILGERPGAPAEERVQQKTLGQDDFFKLLTTQLSSQDPLKPMEDTEFISQMANFSSLEMMSSLNRNFETFTGAQQFKASQGFIGKQVSLLVDGEEIEGVAEAVEQVDGVTRVFIDGKGYNIDSVFKVAQS